ncbi:helix-turn-helix domain-containing protein [Brockia lithotrophica]|uniref:Two-component system response regulator RegA n=1 Tax=Brockia lithotrophica TaxID=933949 RepID=A0A660KZN6_9BACL|nr:helix-turn-helix domain-containing protein [Brockia lithotrophica]RKQ84152.1 two-component system response regulator RegA [Brockia lithotrophica]
MRRSLLLAVGKEADFFLFVQEALLRTGTEVHYAESFAEASKHLRWRRYDVLLLWPELADLDGLTAARRLHDLDYLVRLLYVSPRPSVREAVAAMKAGASEYLEWPVTPERLQAVVAQELKARREEPSPLSLAEVERRHILFVLDLFSGNRRKTAEALGISPRTLYNKLRDFGLVDQGEMTQGKPR